MKYLRLIVIVLALVGVGFAFFEPSLVSASTAADEICEGIGGTAGSDGCTQDAGEPSVDSAIATVVNILSLIVGLVAVIMIIFGGFKYVTAAGDSGKTSSARNTIIYAIVGLVIVALAQFIVQFVVRQVFTPDEETSLMIASISSTIL